MRRMTPQIQSSRSVSLFSASEMHCTLGNIQLADKTDLDGLEVWWEPGSSLCVEFILEKFLVSVDAGVGNHTVDSAPFGPRFEEHTADISPICDITLSKEGALAELSSEASILRPLASHRKLLWQQLLSICQFSQSSKTPVYSLQTEKQGNKISYCKLYLVLLVHCLELLQRSKLSSPLSCPSLSTGKV